VVGPSWDDVDEVALLQIAPRHKKRRITNGNVRTHQTDWVNVANEFNAVANVQRSSEALRNRWIRLNKWHSATDGPSSTVLAAELTGSDSLTAEDNAQQSDVQGEEMSGALGEEAAAEVMAEDDMFMDAFPTSSTDTLRPHDLSQPETLQHRLSALPRSTVLTHQANSCVSCQQALQQSLCRCLQSSQNTINGSYTSNGNAHLSALPR
jgi:hypothetical protein